MKNLLLMRHAKSSWKEASLPDHQRPLNGRGKRDAPQMGRHIRDQGIRVDALLCSTAVRARETAVGFLQEYPFDGKVGYIDDLYQAGPETIISVLNQLPDDVETAMVIAHNPGLDEFLEIVCDECGHMPTGCVAYIKYSLERWADLREYSRGELVQLWTPREL
jgi:phosphohistidine phosphatase